MPVPRIKAINIRSGQKFDVYGGRGPKNAHMLNTKPGNRGWLGNPYALAPNHTPEHREGVLLQYETAFLDRVKNNQAFRVEVSKLANKTLACYCKPLSCHLDVVVAYVKQYTCCESCLKSLKREMAFECRFCLRFNYCETCSGVSGSCPECMGPKK